MGFLGTGWTILASLQKSGGRSASSGGDERWIARSVVRRSRSRSARPRVARSLLLEGLEVRLALTSIAQPSRDDATNNHAGLGPVGVDHGKSEPLGQPDGHDPPLAVVPARVFALQRGPSKMSVAKSKSKPRSRRLRALFRRSQPKRTDQGYGCIYSAASERPRARSGRAYKRRTSWTAAPPGVRIRAEALRAGSVGEQRAWEARDARRAPGTPRDLAHRLEEVALAWRELAQGLAAEGKRAEQVSALLRAAGAQQTLGRYADSLQTLAEAQAAERAGAGRRGARGARARDRAHGRASRLAREGVPADQRRPHARGPARARAGPCAAAARAGGGRGDPRRSRRRSCATTSATSAWTRSRRRWGASTRSRARRW